MTEETTTEVTYVHPRNLAKAQPQIQPQIERLEERRERLTRAYEEIRTMDVDLAEAKAKIAEQQQQIGEQAAMIEFLDGRDREREVDLMAWRERAVKLSVQMQTIWHLCQEGDVIARATAAIEAAGGMEKKTKSG